MKNILVIAAHPDDEVLGIGGTVRKLTDEGKTVRAVIMAEGLTSRGNVREDIDEANLLLLQEDARKSAREVGYASIDFCGFPDNRMDGVDLLDIVKKVNEYADRYKPDTIFTHHHGDLNIDHRRTCEAVLTATRPTEGCGVKRIYAFETPSSTEWNYIQAEPFVPNFYVDVRETLEAKVRAMAFYTSENTVYPHPRSAEALRALGRYRGSNVGFEMAEGFMLMRQTVKTFGEDWTE